MAKWRRTKERARSGEGAGVGGWGCGRVRKNTAHATGVAEDMRVGESMPVRKPMRTRRTTGTKGGGETPSCEKESRIMNVACEKDSRHARSASQPPSRSGDNYRLATALVKHHAREKQWARSGAITVAGAEGLGSPHPNLFEF